MKRFLSVLTAVVLLSALALPALAAETKEPEERETVYIDSVQDFLDFASACADTAYSENKLFVLRRNLDLGGAEFSPVPWFAGEFRGGGHSITGVSITRPGSRQGLFRTVTGEGEISSLSVFGTVTPGGSRSIVGGIAGECGGTLRDCSFEGTVSGRSQVGGLCGYARESAVILNCRAAGKVSGEHDAGGVCGSSDGLIADCTNAAAVNTEAVVPEREERMSLSEFDLSSFSAENYLDITDLGGICGKSTGVILRCTNKGGVGYHYAGYNVGGICGLTAGYISGCENSGEVQGRRDVGGIAGQLLPDIRFDFSEGKLDGVESSLQGLNWSIASASNLLNENADNMAAELQTVAQESQTLTAELGAFLRQLRDNEDSLRNGFRQDPETGAISFSGWDSVDPGPLTAAIGALLGEYDAILAMADESSGELMGRLLNVSASISNLMGQLNKAIQHADLAVEELDLSVTEGYARDRGAIDGCVNTASVTAEDCAGGVAGSVAYELDFDKEDLSGLSDAFAAEVKEVIFAVLRGCESYGSAEVKNDYVGGIVGKMELGAVLDCTAAGSVTSLNGDYAGGIAGKTAGTVQGSFARPLLAGHAYVGGIAGEAEKLRDCCACAAFERWDEYTGALAGWVTGESENCVFVRCTPSGVDGVSYAGQMTAVSYEELLERQDLPAAFRNVTVRFIGPDGTACETLSLPFGGAVDALPEIGRDGERYWRWDSAELSSVCRDTEVRGQYISPVHTLSTGEDVPAFLVEGSFYEGQQLSVTPVESDTAGGRFTAWRVEVSGYEGTLTVRMFAEGPGKVLLCLPDGTRRELSAATDGRYRVFTVRNGDCVAFEPVAERSFGLIGLCGLAAAGLAVAALLLTRRRRRAKAAEAEKTAVEGTTEDKTVCPVDNTLSPSEEDNTTRPEEGNTTRPEEGNASRAEEDSLSRQDEDNAPRPREDENGNSNGLTEEKAETPAP